MADQRNKHTNAVRDSDINQVICKCLGCLYVRPPHSGPLWMPHFEKKPPGLKSTISSSMSYWQGKRHDQDWLLNFETVHWSNKGNFGSWKLCRKGFSLPAALNSHQTLGKMQDMLLFTGQEDASHYCSLSRWHFFLVVCFFVTSLDVSFLFSPILLSGAIIRNGQRVTTKFPREHTLVLFQQVVCIKNVHAI